MERKEAIRSAYRLTGGNKPFWKKADVSGIQYRPKAL